MYSILKDTSLTTARFILSVSYIFHVLSSVMANLTLLPKRILGNLMILRAALSSFFHAAAGNDILRVSAFLRMLLRVMSVGKVATLLENLKFNNSNIDLILNIHSWDLKLSCQIKLSIQLLASPHYSPPPSRDAAGPMESRLQPVRWDSRGDLHELSFYFTYSPA